jgi:hypothetical protein
MLRVQICIGTLEDRRMTEMDGGTRSQLAKSLAEIRGLVSCGARATSRQAEDWPVQSAPGAELDVRELHDRLERQRAGLEQRLAELGGRPEPDSTADSEGPPSSVGRASEAIVRDGEFLQRLSLAYLRLQSAGRSLGDDETARLAEHGYHDTQHLLRERISRATPRAAATDHALPSRRARGTVE